MATVTDILWELGMLQGCGQTNNEALQLYQVECVNVMLGHNAMDCTWLF